MLPDRVSNPGPLTYESGALAIALRCPATLYIQFHSYLYIMIFPRLYLFQWVHQICRALPVSLRYIGSGDERTGHNQFQKVSKI